LALFQFMKKCFFNKEKFVKEFSDNNGLSNILILMIQYINLDKVCLF
jgi:hypothetical protein